MRLDDKKRRKAVERGKAAHWCVWSFLSIARRTLLLLSLRPFAENTKTKKAVRLHRSHRFFQFLFYMIQFRIKFLWIFLFSMADMFAIVCFMLRTAEKLKCSSHSTSRVLLPGLPFAYSNREMYALAKKNGKIFAHPHTPHPTHGPS